VHLLLKSMKVLRLEIKHKYFLLFSACLHLRIIAASVIALLSLTGFYRFYENGNANQTE
jgi:hypothetical protein